MRHEATGNSSDRTSLGFYFRRSFDMQDASQIPTIVEPWLLAFSANVEIHPVLIPADLDKAGIAIENGVKKYA